MLKLSSFLTFIFSIIILQAQPDYVNWVQKIGAYRSYGKAVATDDEGNVYVTGTFEEWAKVNDKEIQSRGKAFRDPDIFIAKFSKQGDLLWWDHAGGTGDDGALGIAISGDNIYVTGFFAEQAYFGGKLIGTKDRQNMFLANYNKKGELQWVKQAQSDGVLRGVAVTADKDGNAIVTGNFRDYVSFDNHSLKKQLDKNIFIVKVDSKGIVQWLRQGSGGHNFFTFTYAYDVEADKDGNIFVTGEMAGTVQWDRIRHTTEYSYYTDGRLSRREIFLVKYDQHGNLQWMKDVGTEARFEDMAVDAKGNIYITGYYSGAVNGTMEGQASFGKNTYSATPAADGKYSEDYFLAAYNKNGELKWVKTGGTERAEKGIAVTAAANGKIYWSGVVTGDVVIDMFKAGDAKIKKAQIFLAELTPEGSINWLQNIHSTKGATPQAITVDSQSNIFLTGFYYGHLNAAGDWHESLRYENGFILKAMQNIDINQVTASETE